MGKTPLTAVEPEEVKTWLEWAGAKLLSLNIKSPLPKEPHVSWPAYAQDHRTAYGYTGERLRPSQASAVEIELMDQILLLTQLISDVLQRRIVNARALVTPVSNRYVFSWSRLAFMLHTDRRRVARLHQSGLGEICRRLGKEKVDSIRQSYQNFTQ